LKIRNAVVEDVPIVVGLDRSSPTAAHWEERRYQELFETAGNAPERLVLVSEKAPGAPIGFLVARRVAAEWELENIVVAPASRGLGIGKRLLDALVARAREAGGEAVFLEVRESNAGARKLYEKAGFGQTGRRKLYYCDPLEDAILYRKALE